MARPKYDECAVKARQRIIDAFWQLLKSARLQDLTVGAICAEAAVNRNTFYYHFENIDALVYAAIEAELLGANGVPNSVFQLMTEADQEAVAHVDNDPHIRRLSRLLKNGGMEIVDAKTKSVLLNMWHEVLCPDDGELRQQTRFIIEYAISGMIGILSYRWSLEREGQTLQFPVEFVRHTAEFILHELSKAEGISESEILTRMETIRNQRAQQG